MSQGMYTRSLNILLSRSSYTLLQARNISLTAYCNYRPNRKIGGRKKYKIPLNWRDADWNPASIPSAWKPENFDEEQLIDYKNELERAKYLPGYKPKIASTLQEDYHEKALYSVTSDSCLTEGLAQMLFISKSVILEKGLPLGITKVLNNMKPVDKERVIQVIQHANLFDVDPRNLDKTNRRKEYKQDNYDIYCKPDRLANTMTREFIRLCDMNSCQTSEKFYERINLEGIRFTATFRRQTSYDKETIISTHLPTEWIISIQGHADIQVLAKSPLKRFAGTEMVQATNTECLNSLYPVLPIVDIPPIHNYTLKTSTGLNQISNHPHLHTMVLFNKSNLSASEMHGKMLAAVFSALYSKAVEMHGEKPMDLDEPLVAQVIGSNGQMLNFMCFQLNTTKLHTDDGIKNMVWVDDFYAKEATKTLLDDTYSVQHSQLYEECSHRYWEDPQYYHGYNHDVFKTFQSLWLNGVL